MSDPTTPPATPPAATPPVATPPETDKFTKFRETLKDMYLRHSDQPSKLVAVGKDGLPIPEGSLTPAQREAVAWFESEHFKKA